MKNTLLLLIAALATIFSARAYDFAINDIYYTKVTSNTVEVSGCSSSLRTLDIPSTFDRYGVTYTVTSIGNSAFRSRRISSVTIPNTVTSIGEQAFYNCSSLSSVTIPNSVTTIGNSAFSSCIYLSSVTIGNSVTSIGNSAFSSCSKLTSIALPNSVTTIGNSAFSFCSSLSSVTMQNSVTSIGESAFYSCNQLTSITLSSALTSIEEQTFNECGKLESIDIPASVVSIGEYAFQKCASLTTVTLHNGLSTIGMSAFINCSKLSEIILPGTVTSIGSNAFQYCYDLTAIDIPDSVISLGSSAFYSCKKLATVTLGKSLAEIRSSCFYGCEALTSITIPASLTSIAGGTFNDCKNLDTVTFKGLPSTFGGNPFINCPALRVIAGTGASSDNRCLIKDGVLVTFASSGLTEYTIPGNVTAIGPSAFINCSNLGSVTLPTSLTTIDGAAFSGCGSLASITLPTSLTTIGINAFNGCDALTEITIPENVQEIKLYAFGNCSSLKKVTLQAKNCTFGYNYSNTNDNTVFKGSADIDEVILPEGLTKVPDYMCMGLSNLKNIVIPSTVTEIGNNAFYGCSLVSIDIPDNVTKIGEYAFWNCKSGYIELGTGVKTICVSAFYGNNNAIITSHAVTPPTLGSSALYSPKEIRVPSQSLDAYKAATNWSEFSSCITAIPQAGEIGYYFEYGGKAYEITSASECKLAKKKATVYGGNFVLPGTVKCGSDTYTVTSTGNGLDFSDIVTLSIPSTVSECDGFESCRMLESVTVNSGNPYLRAVDGVLYNKDMTTLIYYPDNKAGAYATPSGVQRMTETFRGKKRLTSLTISDGIEGSAWLTDNEALTEVVLGDGIAGADFYGCRNLESLVIGAGVTELMSNSFKKCYKLEKLIIKDSPTPLTISYTNYDDGYGGLWCETNIRELYMGRNLEPWSNYYSWSSVPFRTNHYLHKFSVGPDVTTILENVMKASAPYAEKYFCSFDQWLNMNWKGTEYSGYGLHFGGEAVREMTIPEGSTLLKNMLANCETLEVLNLPASLAITGSKLYYGIHTCNNLRKISVAEGNTSAYTDDDVLYAKLSTGSDVLVKYPAQKSAPDFKIGENVGIVYRYAFANCQNLQSLTIPSTCTSFGDYVFTDCGALKSIRVKNDDPSNFDLGAYLFDNTPTDITLYVPAGSADRYSQAYPWRNFNISEIVGTIDLVDATTYDITSDTQCDNLTYTRNFKNTNWQPLYVPYNMAYKEWCDEAEVAELYNIRGYDKNGDGEIDEVTIEFNRVNSGEIQPNVPYIIRSKSEKSVTFTGEEKLLRAKPAQEGYIECSSTMFTYGFYGIYDTKSDMYSTGAYTLTGGTFSHVSSDKVTLKPYRFYMMITPKTGGYNGPAAPQKIKISVDGEETTAIDDIIDTPADGALYDLMGRRVENPAPGIYIRDGKKVYIKQ